VPTSSTEIFRDFGPDAAPRRRRTPTKSAGRAERGPKRPIYKRTPGPVRFSMTDDDGDEEEYDVHGMGQQGETDEHDTA
jgi:hypothetical protein